ncbi:MAG: crotonase/enoyl-CoA hydratase family protein [Pseudomonadota bacterium]
MSSRLTLHVDDQIALVTLSRADRHNALDLAMFEEIDAVIKRLRKDRSLRAVVVTGEGEDFCTGIDVKSVLESRITSVKLLFKWLPGQSNLVQRISTGWRAIPCPVIMALHGRVWGGGLQIALGGDLRVASPETDLSILEARWGLLPDMGGTLCLREQLPVDVAKYLAMTAKHMTAAQALHYRLITEVAEQPLDRAMAIAAQISCQSPDSVAAVKKLYNRSAWHSQRYALARETWYQIKILLGKNQRTKTYRELNPDKPAKDFAARMDW